ncbi:hypothetical protein B0T10DRAFT_152378 [Thelonectria olida]|uniref:C3H1-type domain-containing protein n=1 Tax=Thelonectria olida TaxID=1576542 RepID=A0A9P8VY05_9HYPO|nr:hypothetical protein B0T10DRAFT_152378 [Thelonectria olida]
MLPDETIESAAEQLAEYRRNDALSDILERYATLIEHYRRLKSDYEEEKEGRERYKQLARGQERNPFALVVIDGDGYVFDESFVGACEEGGSRAAKQLNDSIKMSLRRKGLEGCEAMIRVYADLVGLSKCLYKNGLCGAEKRSLAPFTSGFNRSYGLTDFVDAGELKENADFKLKAMLRLYADNTQCKHIYFAACHDVGYVSDLTPYRGNSERFTLVRTPSARFHLEFNKLGMNVEDFPGVFRSTPLISVASAPGQTKKNASMSVSKFSAQISSNHTQQPRATSPVNGNKICQYNAMGKCRYGSTCRLAHIDSKSSQLNRNGSPPSYKSQNWRSDNDGTSPINRTSGIFPPGNDIASLPRPHDIPEDHIAVNEHQERLDAYIVPPTPDIFRRIKPSPGQRKLCNQKQLTGYCPNEECEFDHTPIPDELKPALEALSRSVPCPKRGNCRKLNCVFGHVCQRLDCKRRGGKAYCRFPPSMCMADFTVDGYVPAVMTVTTDPSTVGWEDEHDHEQDHDGDANGLSFEGEDEGVSI